MNHVASDEKIPDMLLKFPITSDTEWNGRDATS